MSERIRRLMSGEASGVAVCLARGALGGAAWLYGAGMSVRNTFYDKGICRSYALNAPVISVGNLTAGGTGKTPMVVWLAETLRALGRRPGVLSRGYGAQGGENDENQLLGELLEGVPVVAHRDRVAGGRRALERHGANVLILDDGFQHRRLRRDLDIVLIDATCPFGYGYGLPRGLLREAPAGLKRAGWVVITRSDLVSGGELARIEAAVRSYGGSELPVVTAVHRPAGLLGGDGRQWGVAALAGRRVWVACAIGNPRAFVRQVAGLGAQVAGETFFPDHAPYRPGDLDRLLDQAGAGRADWVVITDKDWMKLRELEGAQGCGRLVRLQIKMEFGAGVDILTGRLRGLCAGGPG